MSVSLTSRSKYGISWESSLPGEDWYSCCWWSGEPFECGDDELISNSPTPDTNLLESKLGETTHVISTDSDNVDLAVEGGDG